MNNEYLAKAKTVMPEAKELIIVASRRARQLAYGARPMVRCKDENFIDVALLEIAEGKLAAKCNEEGGDFLREIDAFKAKLRTESSEAKDDRASRRKTDK